MRAAAVLVLAAAVAGCSGRDKASDVLAQDTTLTRDLALANQDTVSRPQLTDVPVTAIPETPAPSAPAPRAQKRVVAPVKKKPAPRAIAPAPAPVTPTVRVTDSGNTERGS